MNTILFSRKETVLHSNRIPVKDNMKGWRRNLRAVILESEESAHRDTHTDTELPNPPIPSFIYNSCSQM